MGEVPGAVAGGRPTGGDAASETPHPAAEPGPDNTAVAERHAHLAQGSRHAIPLDPEMQRRLDEARRAAAEHAAHAEPGCEPARRAPRPERLQR
jgi:hypothetical protein